MTDFVDLLEAQLVDAHRRRTRGPRLTPPSRRTAGALVAAMAAAAATVVLLVALASPGDGAPGRRAGTPAPPRPARTVPHTPTQPIPPPAAPAPRGTPTTPLPAPVPRGTPTTPRPAVPVPRGTPTTPTAPPPAATVPLPAAPAPSTTVPAVPMPADAIAVLNATGRNAAGRATADRLTRGGFDVGVVTNDPRGRAAHSRVLYAGGHRAGAVAVALLLRIRRVERLDRTSARRVPGAEVVVVVGADRGP